MSQAELGPNPIEKLQEWSTQSQGDKVFLRQPLPGGQMKTYSFKEVYAEAQLMASALHKAGLANEKIAILSKNCASWIISDFAILMSGAISVPFFPTFSKENLKKIIEHSGVKLIFCGKLDGWSELQKIIPPDVLCISYPDFPLEKTTGWNDFVQRYGDKSFQPVARKADELVTITYTSGSTGMPKGVMHNLSSLTFVGKNIRDLVDFSPKDRVISYLPISHVAERALHEFGALYGGTEISFVESIESFSKTLNEVQPDIFLAVPRIWQKMQAAVQNKLPDKKLDRLLSLPVVGSVLKHIIRKRMGLVNARHCICGTAPLAPSVVEWFKKLGILIKEGYGMTETFAYAHFSLQKVVKDGSVGMALPGVESRLSEIGEVQTRSPSNMVGFYRDEALTREAFTPDGFVKTGDLGRMDADGYLYITGRCKELFKTAKGEYIVPNQLESKLQKCELIDQICVMGAGMDAPYGVMTLNPLLKEQPDSLIGQLKELLLEVNRELKNHEKISKLLVTSQEWSIEGGFLTPTLKIKRAVIEKHYEDVLKKHCTSKDKVIFISE